MKRIYEIAVLSKGSFARTVRIYAPKKADRAIIMHDGQNVFDDKDAAFNKSWRAAEILRSSDIKNTAIVGIDCTAMREYDYLPFPTELDKYGYPTRGGGASIYSDYIEQIVIPYLDKRFGFSFYGVLGSSAGALATIDIAARKNPRIKAYGMFSTPLYVSPEAFEKLFESAPFDKNAYYLVYTGGNERIDEIPDPDITEMTPQLFVDDAFKTVNGLRKSGVTDLELLMKNTAVHDEISWRLPEKLFFEKVSKLNK